MHVNSMRAWVTTAAGATTAIAANYTTLNSCMVHAICMMMIDDNNKDMMIRQHRDHANKR
jgi:hypothetical protein